MVCFMKLASAGHHNGDFKPCNWTNSKIFFADDNQRLCASLLPYTFKLLQECQQETIVQPLTAFLGLLVANNGETAPDKITVQGICMHNISSITSSGLLFLPLVISHRLKIYKLCQLVMPVTAHHILYKVCLPYRLALISLTVWKCHVFFPIFSFYTGYIAVVHVSPHKSRYTCSHLWMVLCKLSDFLQLLSRVLWHELHILDYSMKIPFKINEMLTREVVVH